MTYKMGNPTTEQTGQPRKFKYRKVVRITGPSYTYTLYSVYNTYDFCVLSTLTPKAQQ
jgi:hypothetical protein